MKKINMITIFGVILILCTLIFAGCTEEKGNLEGRWQLVKIFGNAPNPNVVTTWEFFGNGTFLTQTVDPFEETSLWQSYEIVDNELHTIVIGSGIPMDYRFKLSDDGSVLSLMSLMQSETENYTMVFEKL